jgi:predicted RNA-binding Zn ribbon-like protein
MQHSPAIFIGDAKALDFLNSVATPVDVPVDWLEDGEGLMSWLQQAGLVPVPILARMRSQCSPGELNKVAKQARNLREWFRGFVQEHRGRPMSRHHLKQLAPLNRLLDHAETFTQIVPATSHAGSALELQAMRKWQSPEALLSPIAEALALFVCGEDFSYVKACEGPVCTLLFADHSRRRTRRWCSMAICGNRAKQAAHRRRLQAER